MVVTETATPRGLRPGLRSSQVYVVVAAGQRSTVSTKHWESGVSNTEAEGHTRRERSLGQGLT